MQIAPTKIPCGFRFLVSKLLYRPLWLYYLKARLMSIGLFRNINAQVPAEMRLARCYLVKILYRSLSVFSMFFALVFLPVTLLASETLSLVEAVEFLRSKGYKILFIPFIQPLVFYQHPIKRRYNPYKY